MLGSSYGMAGASSHAATVMNCMDCSYFRLCKPFEKHTSASSPTSPMRAITRLRGVWYCEVLVGAGCYHTVSMAALYLRTQAIGVEWQHGAQRCVHACILSMHAESQFTCFRCKRSARDAWPDNTLFQSRRRANSACARRMSSRDTCVHSLPVCHDLSTQMNPVRCLPG